MGRQKKPVTPSGVVVVHGFEAGKERDIREAHERTHQALGQMRSNPRLKAGVSNLARLAKVSRQFLYDHGYDKSANAIRNDRKKDAGRQRQEVEEPAIQHKDPVVARMNTLTRALIAAQIQTDEWMEKCRLKDRELRAALNRIEQEQQNAADLRAQMDELRRALADASGRLEQYEPNAKVVALPARWPPKSDARP